MEWLAFFIDSPAINALSKVLLHFLWQGCLIAFALYVCLNFLHKKHSEIRYVVSLAAMGLCVVVPVFTFFYFYQPVTVITLEHVSPFVVSSSSGDPAIVSSWYLFNWDFIMTLATMLWMLGVIYLTAHLVAELIKVYTLPSREVMEPELEINAVFHCLVETLQVNKLTRLLISLKAEVPMVIGFIRPVVLVPFSMASGLTSSQLEMLLAHELAHVKRHDYLINFFQTLAEILLFFHPLVKWISTQIRIEREYCCDDIAVETCGNAKAYATALTDAELIRNHHIPQLAMAASGGDLKERVVRMVEHSDCADRYSRSWHSMALAAMVSVVLATMIFSAHAGYKARVAQVLNNESELTQSRIQVSNGPTQEAEKQIPNKLVAGEAQVMSMTQQGALEDRASLPGLANFEAKPEEPKIELKTERIANRGHQTQISLSNKRLPELTIPDVAMTSPSNDNKPVEPISLSKTAVKAIDNLPEQSVSDVSVNNTNAVIASLQDDEMQTTSTLNTRDDSSADNSPSNHQPKGSSRQATLISIVAPSLVKNARPNYPRTAISRGVEADVKVSFVVDRDGRITEIDFESGVPGYFKRSIRRALRLWRFEPGSIDGKLTEMTLTRVFSFNDPDADVEDPTRLKVTGSRIVKQI